MKSNFSKMTLVIEAILVIVALGIVVCFSWEAFSFVDGLATHPTSGIELIGGITL